MLSTIKYIADPLVRIAKLIFEEIHRDLSRYHQVSGTVIAENRFFFDTEIITHRFDHLFIRNRTKYVFDAIFPLSYVRMLDSESSKARTYGINGWHAPVELILSNHLVENTLYLSYIAAEIVGDILGYFLWDDKFFFTSFLLEDSQTSLKIWFINIDHDPPLKSAHESWLDFSEFFWRTVRTEDDLFSRIVEDIKKCIDFFLCPLFASQKLDIIDEEDIDSSEASAHLIDFPILDGIDIFRHKLV